MMHDQNRAKIQRLSLWFALNLVIFVACYLNYRVQLKHRYLFKTLNAGLCLSRAAAMVINFNLILVWLPMCKYTLTRLAVLASNSASRQREKLHHYLISSTGSQDQVQTTKVLSPPLVIARTPEQQQQQNPAKYADHVGGMTRPEASSVLGQFVHKLNWSADRVIWRTKYTFSTLKIKLISSFLIAVDHCTSLHTICATTITIASVIHTVAHLMNVINFSNNFDPLLGELNMAEYKGQNPFQLLVSVPGITGCLMMTILLLMSLSSISIIRSSSFDMFQIFHRLSVLFVFLLILHPSSHILKEQNNVSRHNPDLCYNKLVLVQSEQIHARHSNNSAALTTARTTSSSFSSQLRFAPPPPLLDETAAALAEASSESVAISAAMRAAQSATLVQSQMAPPRMQSLAAKNRSTEFAARQWKENSPNPPPPPLSLSTLAANYHQFNNNTNTNTNYTANLRNSLETFGGPSQALRDNGYELHQGGDHATTSSSAIVVKQKREILQDDRGGEDKQGDERTTAQAKHKGNTLDNGHPRQLGENLATGKLETPVNLKSSARLAINYADGYYGNVTTTMQDESLCLDLRPTFVAQSSICWYVLGAGLSCYLLDLILRRLRRSKSTIHLLDACTDAEGNLIELVLSNNHKRFAHWLPGQYVYLNCPQIATHEWHPFTISSMDNDTKQFTLHIKTGGDWTRKLRYELELRKRQQQRHHQTQSHLSLDCCCLDVKGNSMSLFFEKSGGQKGGESHLNNNNNNNNNITSNCTSHASFGQLSTAITPLGKLDYSKIVNVVATFDCYDHKTGQVQVECRRFVHLAHQDSARTNQQQQQQQHQLKYANDCLKIDLDKVHWNEKLYSICSAVNNSYAEKPVLTIGQPTTMGQIANLDLFIDGPFHSPFERLLEQQVSVCIANGVGWTAFSAVFQQITNELSRHLEDPKKDWWSQWRNFPSSNPRKLDRSHSNFNSNLTTSNEQNLSTNSGIPVAATAANSPTMINKKLSLSIDTKLHLMVIVTTIEQLKPFYKIVLKYFKRMEEGAKATLLPNPIQEITAFITRSTRRDSDVINFCQKENLSLANLANESGEEEDDLLRINETLVIRFGRPDFDEYLNKFSNLYKDKRKISVYCCGSYQVKRRVEEICQNLSKKTRQEHQTRPIYHYHEENF